MGIRRELPFAIPARLHYEGGLMFYSNFEYEMYDKVVMLDHKGNKHVGSICSRHRLGGYPYYIVFTEIDHGHYKFARFECELLEFRIDENGDLI